MALKIIKETPEFIIIDKPTGLLTHSDTPLRPGSAKTTPGEQGSGGLSSEAPKAKEDKKSKEPTLVDLLLKKYPGLAKIGDPERPGIVHRLDKETSGLLVVARTPEMFEHLKKAFASREVKKEYTLLVHGKLSKDEGEIDFVIARSRRGGRMAARPTSQEGRGAKTSYEAIKQLPNKTLVRAMPETGRTHQIRAHFHALGHPIVGDPLYKTKKQRRKDLQKPQKTSRMMLHATKLSFPDLSGKIQTFKSPLPEDFKV